MLSTSPPLAIDRCYTTALHVVERDSSQHYDDDADGWPCPVSLGQPLHGAATGVASFGGVVSSWYFEFDSSKNLIAFSGHEPAW